MDTELALIERISCTLETAGGTRFLFVGFAHKKNWADFWNKVAGCKVIKIHDQELVPVQ